MLAVEPAKANSDNSTTTQQQHRPSRQGAQPTSQPGSHACAQAELRAVGVRPGVGHGEDACIQQQADEIWEREQHMNQLKLCLLHAEECAMM